MDVQVNQAKILIYIIRKLVSLHKLEEEGSS